MTGNLVLSIVSILFALFYLVISFTQLPPSTSPITLGPRAWPVAILSLMIVMGIILFIRTLNEKRKSAAKEELLTQSEKIEEEFEVEEVYKSKYLFISGILLLTLLSLSYLGFIVTAPIMLIAIALIIGVKRWLPIVLASIIGTACLTYLFPILLSIPLPRGVGIFKTLSQLFY